MDAIGSEVAVLREETCRSCVHCGVTHCRQTEPDCTCSSPLWKSEHRGLDKAGVEEDGEDVEARVSGECQKLVRSKESEAQGGGSGSVCERGEEAGQEQAADPEDQQRRRQQEQGFHSVVMNGYGSAELGSAGEGEDDEEDVDDDEEEETIHLVHNGSGGSVFTPRFRRRAEEAGWDENALLMGMGALDEMTEAGVGGGPLFPEEVTVAAVGTTARSEVVGEGGWRRREEAVPSAAIARESTLSPGRNHGADEVVIDNDEGVEEDHGNHAVSVVMDGAVTSRQSPREMARGAEDASAGNGVAASERDRERKREVRTPGLARTPVSAERRYRRMRHTADEVNENEGMQSTSSEALRRIREGGDVEACLERSRREFGRRLEAIQASRRIVLERAEERTGVSTSSAVVGPSDPCEFQGSSARAGEGGTSPRSGEGGKDQEKERAPSEKDRKQGVASRIAQSNGRPLELPCLEQLRQELSCAVCLEICVEPSTTTCGHSFCSSCLRSSIQRCGPKCPKCRHPLGADAALHCPVNTVLWNTIQLLFPEVSAAMSPRKCSTSAMSPGNQLSSLVIPGPHPLMHMLPTNARTRHHTRGLARIAAHLVTGEGHAVHSHFVHNTPRLRSAARVPSNNPFREPRSATSMSMPSTLVTSDSHRPAMHSVSLRRGGSNIGPIPSSVANTRVVPDRNIEEDDESENDDMDLFSGAAARLTESNAEGHNPVRARFQAYMRTRRNDRDDRTDRHEQLERLDALLLGTRLQRPDMSRDDDSPPSPSLSSPSSLPQVLITSASAAAASNQLASVRSDTTRSGVSRSATSSRSAVGQTPQLRHGRHP
ncbi:hypothetical protein CBR_g51805 [Chara braunii]|uniref:RING-type E3 ubiquitin transferase n=1 Tax=Chara braunii TaxID=69332 RepID=A0A388M933_CHABU|nr:hypothetical protein CBR_g51805 [Chara braunii]|eukprot:GBG91071.1 hypothetical protein CBR_g51805 [Chara braunii]